MELKPKKCKQCENDFKPVRPLQSVCSYSCAKKYAKVQQKAKKQRLKDSVVKYSTLMSQSKEAFQKWVRLRDKDKPCISCGTLTAGQWHGSHFYKAEVYRGVIFHEWNVWKSCSYCNRILAGNLIPYREELIKRIGIEKVQLLDKEANETRQRKWTREELVEIREIYKQKIKLKKI